MFFPHVYSFALDIATRVSKVLVGVVEAHIVVSTPSDASLRSFRGIPSAPFEGLCTSGEDRWSTQLMIVLQTVFSLSLGNVSVAREPWKCREGVRMTSERSA